MVGGRIIVALVMATALASPSRRAHAQTAAGVATLHDLRGVDDLRARFDRDRDTIRIVLLLSPT